MKVADVGQRDAAIEILRRAPGDIPVTFYHADEKRIYAAPRELWAGERTDLSALRALLGGDQVVLKS